MNIDFRSRNPRPSKPAKAGAASFGTASAGQGWPARRAAARVAYLQRSTVPTEVAPSLRSLQGWAAMLHAPFDFVRHAIKPEGWPTFVSPRLRLPHSSAFCAEGCGRVGTTDLDSIFIRPPRCPGDPRKRRGACTRVPAATVRGAHASKTAKRGAASFVKVQAGIKAGPAPGGWE
jgi:hypothetical protein